MDINQLTIGQGKELAALFYGIAAKTAPQVTACPDLDEGLCICVLDKGFVYVGELIIDGNGKLFTITNAKNIRRWGTTDGLGQLAKDGPQEDTSLDSTGTVRALTGELKHWIKCEIKSWT